MRCIESSQVAQHSYTENMVVSSSQLCTLAGGRSYVVQGQHNSGVQRCGIQNGDIVAP